MTRVAILIYPDTALFELGCAVELFALPRPEYPDWYETDVVCFGEQAVRATGNIMLQAKPVASLTDYDMLVIPGWPLHMQPAPDLIDEIQALHGRGGTVVSFCSGAFLLAASGLLDGQSATTHWRYADVFRDQYPDIHYVDDVLYLFHNRLGCAAGSSAALDLGMAIIRQQHGYRVANQVARRLVMAAHRSGGQSQFVEAPVARTSNHFADTLDWAISNLTTGLTIDALAKRANMSRRNFDRKFRASMNISANEWLVLQKLELAKQLLESTQLPIERVASRAGFENAITMRHHFRKHLQSSPSRFRTQFGRAQ
ncbi:transcriptional regulator [Pseudohongiella acticola]|uniref:Transcriptional regulator n=1 Tax=Pseudohongiella acticola TaxID=1524254 RepID=A0A1E8CN03_9GAMM|nr:helix-turn-helix domain-containing protein [Pseudohongiella acticola]OFE13685.1 transcriptional regulator [Pseudohongiella acticola]